MVMKNAFVKSLFRLFRSHFVRLLSIAAIVTVSVALMSGLGEVEGRIELAGNGYYVTHNTSDIYLKSTNEGDFTSFPFQLPGFSADELEQLEARFGKENVSGSFYYEDKIGENIVRAISYDFENAKVNKLELLEGSLPSSPDELLVGAETVAMKSYAAGEKVTLLGKEFTVSGIALHPLYLNKIEEPSFRFEDESLDYILFIRPDAVPELVRFQIVNDVYISLTDRALFDGFSKEYKAKIDGLKTELKADFPEAEVLSLYENFGMYSMIEYAQKVGYIAIIFVVFFLLVTILVVYSNISRLLEEDRGQIACLKTLGRSNFAIILRYLFFVLCGTVLGALVALPFGMWLTRLIYFAFDTQYFMPAWKSAVRLGYYFLTSGIILISMLLLTVFTGLKTVGSKPVALLSHKAPKAGRKVFLERIGFIWKRLSFKYKSTLRNVLLFRSRFYMTVISVIGSTVLVLAGFGLMDCALKRANSASILAIAVALIVFSGLLCGLVVYNLTNINVSERRREIATLMVLGYQDGEVTGYIFREIYIMCAIGAVVGVPLGVGFLYFVFNLVDFGALADLNWWTYLIAPAVTMLFAFLSTLLLRRNIIKTDMNASLKTLE